MRVIVTSIMTAGGGGASFEARRAHTKSGGPRSAIEPTRDQRFDASCETRAWVNPEAENTDPPPTIINCYVP